MYGCVSMGILDCCCMASTSSLRKGLISVYCLLSQILSPVLQDGSENLLRQEIGDTHVEMLLDILVHSEGPRIRDHISHGEVDLHEISQPSANHILCICVAFAGLYIYPNRKSHQNDSALRLVERICETAKAYKSLFHPISLLAKTVRELALSFLKWQDLPKPFGEEFDTLEGDGGKWTVKFPDVETALQMLISSTSLPGDDFSKPLQWQFDLDQIDTFVQGCVEILDATSCSTLFRPKGEMEVALLLRSIAQHGNVISEQARKVLNQTYYCLGIRVQGLISSCFVSLCSQEEDDNQTLNTILT